MAVTAASAPAAPSAAQIAATLLPQRAWLSQVAEQQLHSQHPLRHYTLTLTTGNLRGAGSATPAWVQLVGTNGKSDRIIVGESEEESLARGTRRTVTISTSEDLGHLRFVNVQRLTSSITDAGTGWFLESVVVNTPEQQQVVFPCNAWFGECEGGGNQGPLERNLLPVAPEDLVQGEPVRVSVSGVAVPHPDKVKHDGAKGMNRKGFGHGGEDAYFYCQGKNDLYAMGVADGVYMWRESGIDSGKFSRTLMRLSEQNVRSGIQDVVKVMEMAAYEVHKAGVKGSSTVCVVMVDQAAGQLFGANLGDSGFLLLRPTAPDTCIMRLGQRPKPVLGAASAASAGAHHDLAHAHQGHEQEPPQQQQLAHQHSHPHGMGRHHHAPSPAIPLPRQSQPSEPATYDVCTNPADAYKVRFRTNQLEHDFGRPYQLGHHAHADQVDKCDVASVAVLRGDVIVMGTDGLLDNLSDSEIASEVGVQRCKGSGPSVIAQRLARMAFEAAYDKSRITPYAIAASEHFDMAYSGGKPDDITVLVAICE